MKYEIRRATPEDATPACSVLIESITKCCANDHKNSHEILASWLANKTPENLRNWFSSQGYAIVAISELRIVGVAMLGGNAKIVLCYLMQEARFQGVGQALLEELENEAIRRGQSKIELESTGTAVSFYKKNGYVQLGIEESPLGLKSFCMTKSLKK